MMILAPTAASFHPRSPEKNKFITAASIQQHQKRLSNMGGNQPMPIGKTQMNQSLLQFAGGNNR
jgi:hypothetical protein